MAKEIVTSGEIEILKKINFYGSKIPIFDIEKVLVSNKICVGEKKAISTLLVTCIIVMKLNH